MPKFSPWQYAWMRVAQACFAETYPKHFFCVNSAICWLRLACGKATE